MSALASARAKLRLRQRLRDPIALKHEAELRWWLEKWDPVLRAGGFNPGDAPAFLDDEDVEPTYLGRRWQQARAEVRRVLREAAITDERTGFEWAARYFFTADSWADIARRYPAPGPSRWCPGRAR